MTKKVLNFTSKHPLDLIILDPMYKLTVGRDENIGGHVAEILMHLDE